MTNSDYWSTQSELGPLNAILVENQADHVQGFINTINRTYNQFHIQVSKDYAETQALVGKISPCAFIIDIKLGASVDGISIAQKIRKRYKFVPINFVSSYLLEYQDRLKQFQNLARMYDRLDLRDSVFTEFAKNLFDDASAYHIFESLNVCKMSWENFVNHPNRELIVHAHSRLFMNLARQRLQENGWSWLVICGDRVYQGDKSMKTFPTPKEKLLLAEKLRLVPFVYSRPIVSEEGGHGSYLLHYPKLLIQVQGKSATADLDTGTNQTLVSESLATPDPDAIPEKSYHLGKEFTYYISQREVCFQTLDDNKVGTSPVMMPVAVVPGWDRSPWKIVNPNRQGLIGRDIFAMDAISVQIASTASLDSVLTTISNNKGEAN